MIENVIQDYELPDKYSNGKLACEIEHLLIMHLHELNTIDEIETLKSHIHQMMQDAYIEGQERYALDQRRCRYLIPDDVPDSRIK